MKINNTEALLLLDTEYARGLKETSDGRAILKNLIRAIENLPFSYDLVRQHFLNWESFTEEEQWASAVKLIEEHRKLRLVFDPIFAPEWEICPEFLSVLVPLVVPILGLRLAEMQKKIDRDQAKDPKALADQQQAKKDALAQIIDIFGLRLAEMQEQAESERIAEAEAEKQAAHLKLLADQEKAEQDALKQIIQTVLSDPEIECLYRLWRNRPYGLGKLLTTILTHESKREQEEISQELQKPENEINLANLCQVQPDLIQQFPLLQQAGVQEYINCALCRFHLLRNGWRFERRNFANQLSAIIQRGEGYNAYGSVTSEDWVAIAPDERILLCYVIRNEPGSHIRASIDI